MSQDEVGHYRESFQVITNAVMILPLGFSMSAYYFLARESERRSSAVFNILLFNFLVGGITFLLLNMYPQCLGNIFQSTELTRLAPMIGLVIWIWIFSTFLEMIPIANQEAKVATVYIITASLSKTLFLGGAALTFATVDAFLYAAIIQGVIQTALLLNYVRSRFPGFWRNFDRGFFVEQMTYAVPFGLTGILWVAQNDIHNYFVGYQFSSADFAIYAYGCFQLPLIAMLYESATSVLIPRMNALQLVGDREEMIRLTTRAMQKLAFFYFPIYAFLLITAQTFIVTLFTEKYSASSSVFVINLTLLPISVVITDPIIRSFKELGRLFLLTRFIILSCLIATLYFGLGYFSLTGMITVAVGAVLMEKAVSESIVIRKVGLGLRHLPLLNGVAKTAAITVLAAMVTWLVYSNSHSYLERLGRSYVTEGFGITRPGIVDFLCGSLVLLVAAVVFIPVYLIAASIVGVIEQDEKLAVKRFLRRIFHGNSTPVIEV
jgi:O-antigen/teichoic acid export membrane protein